MTFSIASIPILKDNYQHILVLDNKYAWAIDPGDATAVMSFLQSHSLTLAGVLITHLHYDHIAGLDVLMANSPHTPVFGGDIAQKMCRHINQTPSDFLLLPQLKCLILETPGHCPEQVAFYIPDIDVVFAGDLVFHLGCGRILSGNLTDHFNSLQKLKNLPDSTVIYCSHNYSANNLNFWLSYEPKLKNFTQYPLLNNVSIPLGEEKKWNPFLTDSIDDFIRYRLARNNY